MDVLCIDPAPSLTILLDSARRHWAWGPGGQGRSIIGRVL